MNQILGFIYQHPHCTKYICMTCGGLIGFQQDLDRWLTREKPDLVTLMSLLSEDDLAGIRDWPVFLDLIITRIPEADRHQLYLLARRPFSKPQVDLWLLEVKYTPPDSFNPDCDMEWVGNCVKVIISKNREKEIDSLLRFLGPFASLFPELIACKQEIQSIKQAQKVRDAQKRKEEDDLRRVKQAALEERIAQLSPLTPLEMLEAILQDPEYGLEEYPDDWAAIPIEDFLRFDSVQLTQEIKSLGRRITRKKSKWKDLRTDLYHLRQRVYNQEKGYEK